MKRLILGFTVLALLCARPGQALAGSLLGGNGDVFRPVADFGVGPILNFDLTSNISANGQVDSFGIYAASQDSFGVFPADQYIGGQIELKIFRPEGGTWAYVGGSPMETVDQGGVNVWSLPTPIAVQQGDIIAWYEPSYHLVVQDYPGTNVTIFNFDYALDPNVDVTSDIPNLLHNPNYGGDNWSYDLLRTYSIEVFGTTTSAVPVPSTLVMSSILFGMLGVVSTYRRLKRGTVTA